MAEFVYLACSYKRTEKESCSKFNPEGIVFRSTGFSSIEDRCIKDSNGNGVLFNLIKNAVEVLKPDQGIVEISFFREGDSYITKIVDNGPGIPEEIKDKIFDRFFTYEGEKKQNKAGNGLGLTIVKKLVELHKGEIVVEDQKKGSGAIFITKFDLLREEEKSKVSA